MCVYIYILILNVVDDVYVLISIESTDKDLNVIASIIKESSHSHCKERNEKEFSISC